MVACFFFFLIPSFPEDAKWLREDERAYVKARLRKDQGHSAAERAIGAKDVANVFKDFKIFLGGFVSVPRNALRRPATSIARFSFRVSFITFDPIFISRTHLPHHLVGIANLCVLLDVFWPHCSRVSYPFPAFISPLVRLHESCDMLQQYRLCRRTSYC